MNVNVFLFTGDSTPDQSSPERALLSRTDRAFGFGSYDRQTLLDALANGVRLKITGAGVCHFSSDVDAELADKAIDSFSFKGKLIASPEVTAVLLRKKA